MPRQLSCRDMCKIITWSDDYFSRLLQYVFLQVLDYELITVCEMIAVVTGDES